MSRKYTVRAKVQVVLEVSVHDRWDPSVQVDQVVKQARESALAAVAKRLGPTKTPELNPVFHDGLRVLSATDPDIVLVPEDL